MVICGRGNPALERDRAQQAAAQVAADEAPGAPSMEEVWQLQGRADVIVRALLEAPDHGARQRCEERAWVWLRDVGQAGAR